MVYSSLSLYGVDTTPSENSIHSIYWNKQRLHHGPSWMKPSRGSRRRLQRQQWDFRNISVTSAVLESTRIPPAQRFCLKSRALLNILAKLLHLTTLQCSKFWLNLLAPKNMLFIRVTARTRASRKDQKDTMMRRETFFQTFIPSHAVAASSYPCSHPNR